MFMVYEFSQLSDRQNIFTCADIYSSITEQECFSLQCLFSIVETLNDTFRWEFRANRKIRLCSDAYFSHNPISGHDLKTCASSINKDNETDSDEQLKGNVCHY